MSELLAVSPIQVILRGMVSDAEWRLLVSSHRGQVVGGLAKFLTNFEREEYTRKFLGLVQARLDLASRAMPMSPELRS